MGQTFCRGIKDTKETKMYKMPENLKFRERLSDAVTAVASPVCMALGGTALPGLHVYIRKASTAGVTVSPYLVQPQWEVSRLALQGTLLLYSRPTVGIHKGSLSPGERAWGEAAYLGTWEAKEIVPDE